MVMEDELLSEPDIENYGELHPLIEHDTDIVNSNNGVHDKTYKNSSSGSTERVHKGKDLDRMASIRTSDQSHNLSYEKFISNLEETTNPKKLTKMLGHSGRTGIIWPEQPLDMMAQRLQANTSFTSLKALATHYFPNDDLAHDVNSDNRVIKSNMPYFVRILSKQMVGMYISVWVWRDLQKYIQNLRVSTVGVGAMGYMGNKGSISVSMSIYQTNFCFVCCHLTSGKKDRDELKRNSNVEEILRRTVFNPLPGVIMPKRILDHERIIWLGDLNYRINLSYERTHKLISKQDWDGLFEKDQVI
ncbi:hypothetical protein GUJ93_ZPchr0005g15346 [Zizania palustris]|uniref:Inositol polyphosphate-related phosphatase domain-containing protein n=1 Tax=Zizania palustris TaxID=103762 RepID=A0A8J5VGG0_ZIZPA|nr:hypothetical protein GUJ93_ZPchr0005g15346 [Zizania palustris]